MCRLILLWNLFLAIILSACQENALDLRQDKIKKGVLSLNTKEIEVKPNGKVFLQLSNTGGAELKNISITVQDLPDIHLVTPNSTLDLAPGEKTEIELDADKNSKAGEKGTLSIQTARQSLSIPVDIIVPNAALSFKSSVAELGAGDQASYTLINNAQDSAKNIAVNVTLADSNIQANGIVISNNSCNDSSLSHLKTCSFFVSADKNSASMEIDIHILSDGEELFKKAVSIIRPQLAIATEQPLVNIDVLLNKHLMSLMPDSSLIIYPGTHQAYWIKNISRVSVNGLSFELPPISGVSIASQTTCKYGAILGAYSHCELVLAGDLQAQPSGQGIMRVSGSNSATVTAEITAKPSADDINLSPKNYSIYASQGAKAETFKFTLYNDSQLPLSGLNYQISGNGMLIFKKENLGTTCTDTLETKHTCTYSFSYLPTDVDKYNEKNYTFGFGNNNKISTAQVNIIQYPDNFVNRTVLSSAILPGGIAGNPHSMYQKSGILYASNGKGLSISKDEGKNWINYDTSTGMLDGNIMNIFVDDLNNIYCVLANKAHPLQVSKDEGKTWSYTGTQTPFTLQPGSSQIMYYKGVLYATSINNMGNSVVMYSNDQGQSWRNSLVDGNGLKIINISQLTHSYARDHNVYLVSAQEDNPIPSRIYYSSDQGNNWHDLTIDLSILPEVLNHPGISSLYIFGNEIYMTVIGENPLSRDTTAYLYYSQNHGKDFRKINILNDESPYKVYSHAGVLYIVATNRHDAGILYSEDNGQTWSSTTNIAFAEDAMYAFLEVENQENTLANKVILYPWITKDESGVLPINIGQKNHWKIILPQANFTAQRTLLKNENTVYVATSDKGLAYTKNSGINWQFYHTDNTPFMQDNNVMGLALALQPSKGVVFYTQRGLNCITFDTAQQYSAAFIPEIIDITTQMSPYMTYATGIYNNTCTSQILGLRKDPKFAVDATLPFKLPRMIFNDIPDVLSVFGDVFNDHQTRFNNNLFGNNPAFKGAIFQLAFADGKQVIFVNLHHLNDMEKGAYKATDVDLSHTSNVLLDVDTMHFYIVSSAGLTQLSSTNHFATDDASTWQLKQFKIGENGLPNEQLIDGTIYQNTLYVVASNNKIYSHHLQNINIGRWQEIKTNFPLTKLMHENGDDNLYAIGKNGEFLVHGNVISSLSI